MATRPPNPPPNHPESPDRLERGLRGPVGGVTRIGPRAFALAFVVVCGLLVAILYGLNRGAPTRTADSYASPPAAPPTNAEHFGQNEPIVSSAPPATPPPPLVLPPTSVPDLDQERRTANAQGAPAAAPATRSPDDQAAIAREAAAERTRAEAKDKQRQLAEAALKAPIIAGENSGGAQPMAFVGNGGANGQGFSSNGGNSGGGAAAGGATSNVSGERASAARVQSTAYLQGPSGQYAGVQPANVALPEGGNPKDFLQAQRFAPISPYEITASSVIPAELITAIDSELPGLISAQVREDVYDTKTGRYMLIPRGSRLVGLYNSQVEYGQTRILVAWQRLIFPDTTSIDLLNMSGADVQGGAGVSGDVDNHYGKIFGAAILTSILAAGATLSTPQNSSLLQAPSAGQVISQNVGQEIAQVGTQIVQKDLSIPPTIHVKPGYPFLVIVDRDIVLPGAYHGSAFPQQR
jgi:type IV secretory pathway VirB10-like protein